VVPDVVVDELPPHAVTSTHTAANDMSHVKRFIDILRFDDRQLLAGSDVGDTHLALRCRTAHQRQQGRS